MEYIEIRFAADNATTWAACSITEKAGDYYLVLSLDDSVARYGDSRFIPIELLLNEESRAQDSKQCYRGKRIFHCSEGLFLYGK